jgi:hypothetical protein
LKFIGPIEDVEQDFSSNESAFAGADEDRRQGDVGGHRGPAGLGKTANLELAAVFLSNGRAGDPGHSPG